MWLDGRRTDTDTVSQKAAALLQKVSSQFLPQLISDFVGNSELPAQPLGGQKILCPALRVGRNHRLGADEPGHETKMCPVTDRVRRDRELTAANTALIIFSRLDPTNACRATTWALHALRPAHLPHPADASGFRFETLSYAAYWERHGKPRPVTTERIQFKQLRHGYPTLSNIAGMTLPAHTGRS